MIPTCPKKKKKKMTFERVECVLSAGVDWLVVVGHSNLGDRFIGSFGAVSFRKKKKSRRQVQLTGNLHSENFPPLENDFKADIQSGGHVTPYQLMGSAWPWPSYEVRGAAMDHSHGIFMR